MSRASLPGPPDLDARFVAEALERLGETRRRLIDRVDPHVSAREQMEPHRPCGALVRTREARADVRRACLGLRPEIEEEPVKLAGDGLDPEHLVDVRPAPLGEARPPRPGLPGARPGSRASRSTSPSGNTRPPPVVSITHGISPQSEPTTGTPHESASTRTRPNCSVQVLVDLDGSTSTSISA